MSTERRLLYVDGTSGYDLGYHDGSVQVRLGNRLSQLIPIRRIERVVIRDPRPELFRTLLRLLSEGAAVHFQNGDGELVAALNALTPPTSDWAKEFAWQIQRSGSSGYYHEWLDNQLRHAASLVIRKAPSGPFKAFEQRLASYSTRSLSTSQRQRLLKELEGHLACWVDARLLRDGTKPVVDALHTKKLNLTSDLSRCLSIPVLWGLAPRIRASRRFTGADLIGYLEETRETSDIRLQKHLAALSHHFHMAARRWSDTQRRPRSPRLR